MNLSCGTQSISGNDAHSTRLSTNFIHTVKNFKQEVKKSLKACAGNYTQWCYSERKHCTDHLQISLSLQDSLF